MSAPAFPLFWRVFAVNAALLALATLLLLFTPVTVSRPVRLTEAVVLVIGFGLALAANVVLLRRAFSPLDQLARRMETVDLLQPGQRFPTGGHDEVGRVVHAFNEMLDRLETERHESGRRALAAQEAERLRIARGLHDEVGQVLTGVLLQLDAVADAIASDRRDELVETKQAVRQALEEVRRISRELRPEMLEHLGLVSALTELATTFSRLSAIPVDRRFAAELPPLTADAELAVDRIAQESLTNVARHARCAPGHDRARAGRRLRRASGRRRRARLLRRGGARGARRAARMRERAVPVGGSLAIEPGRDGGVEIRLEVPALPVDAPVRVGV